MNSFDLLSSEAKILFVIGEPIRRDTALPEESWHKQTFQLWREVTSLDFEEFRKAFGEISNWLNSKPKGQK